MGTKPFTISFDIDGVWCDFVFGFTKIAQELGMITHVNKVQEQKYWSFKDSHGLTDAEHGRLVQRLEELGDRFWVSIPPVNGITPWETFKSLQKRTDTEIVFLTSRRFCTVEGIQEWFKRYGQIDISKNKIYMVTNNDKRSAAMQAKVDIHIDDSPEALELLLDKKYPKKLVGIKYKYNEHMWGDPRIIWVDSLIDYLLLCQQTLRKEYAY